MDKRKNQVGTSSGEHQRMARHGQGTTPWGIGGVTTKKTWVYMAKRSTHPGAGTVTDAFSQHTPHAIKNNTLKEIVDPVIKGPTCASPQSPSEDHQWCKLDEKDIGQPLKLPCVFSSTGFVRQLTPREMGRLYNFPEEITKSKVEGQLAGWLERSLIPFKVRLEVVCTIRTWSKTGYCGEAPSPPPQTDTSNIFPPPLKPGKEGGLLAQTQSHRGLSQSRRLEI
ncbi:hypothetical protein ACA910_019155 [Epithemia clementina (nom. ined.)]